MGAVLYVGWALTVLLLAVGIYALAAPHIIMRRQGTLREGPIAASYVFWIGIRDIGLALGLGELAYTHLLLEIPSLLHLAALAAVIIAIAIADFQRVGQSLGGPYIPDIIHPTVVAALVFLLVWAFVILVFDRR